MIKNLVSKIKINELHNDNEELFELAKKKNLSQMTEFADVVSIPNDDPMDVGIQIGRSVFDSRQRVTMFKIEEYTLYFVAPMQKIKEYINLCDDVDEN